jgi:hypothetical protein
MNRENDETMRVGWGVAGSVCGRSLCERMKQKENIQKFSYIHVNEYVSHFNMWIELSFTMGLL